MAVREPADGWYVAPLERSCLAPGGKDEFGESKVTERGYLVLRLRWPADADCGLFGSRALLGRRESNGVEATASPPGWDGGLARKGLIKRPMLKDSRRPLAEEAEGERREEPSWGSPPGVHG